MKLLILCGQEQEREVVAALAPLCENKIAIFSPVMAARFKENNPNLFLTSLAIAADDRFTHDLDTEFSGNYILVGFWNKDIKFDHIVSYHRTFYELQSSLVFNLSDDAREIKESYKKLHSLREATQDFTTMSSLVTYCSNLLNEI